MARLRNLTYESDIFLEMKIEKYRVENDVEIHIPETSNQDNHLIHIGKVPIMVRSEFCLLHNKSD
jgi:DNA-directed RNA polymerase II subunit RPB2